MKVPGNGTASGEALRPDKIPSAYALGYDLPPLAGARLALWQAEAQFMKERAQEEMSVDSLDIFRRPNRATLLRAVVGAGASAPVFIAS